MNLLPIDGVRLFIENWGLLEECTLTSKLCLEGLGKDEELTCSGDTRTAN